ncbi:MAG: hypothetical protein GX446_00170 [Chthonomonadales bacterium]|nr:hypothetical protein [Chthonomonadales bacterium]
MDADSPGHDSALGDRGHSRVARRGAPQAAAAVAAILAAPLVCIWVFRSEILYHSADLASNALSLAAVGALLALLLLRVVLPRMDRRFILLVYAAVAATAGISTMGMVQFLITSLAAPFWFRDGSNRWDEFIPAIPSWVAPRSPEVVRGFFLGRASLYAPEVWQAWVGPVAAWSGFIVLLLVAQYCLAHIFYPRWANQERLSFPIVQLPLTATAPGGQGRSAMLAGALLAAGVQSLNALHYAYPSVPELRVLPTDLGGSFPPPWNAIGNFWLTFYPCAIGVAALVPTNILISCVAFFALSKLEIVGAQAWGLRGTGSTGGFPYPGEQAQGAVLGLVIMVLWSARFWLAGSLRSRKDMGAWIGLGLSACGLVAFGIALGLRPYVCVLFFLLFLLFMVGLGWLRAAVGPLWNPGNDVAWWARAVGGAATPIPEGVGLAYLRWFSFGDFRGHALPTYVDAMRIADAGGISRRTLLVSLAVGSVLSIVASLWVALDVYYRYGAATALTDQWRTYQGRLAFDNLRSLLDGTMPRPEIPHLSAASFGFLLVVALSAANRRLLWWPLHPAGFVMAQTWSLEWFWMPMLIALIVKSLILRAGGLRLYERARPFFVGLILGDYAMCVGLALAGTLFRVPMYKPFPV